MKYDKLFTVAKLGFIVLAIFVLGNMLVNSCSKPTKKLTAVKDSCGTYQIQCCSDSTVVAADSTKSH